MLSSDKSEFNKTLMELFAIYYKQPEEPTYALWWDTFKDYSVDEVKNAFSLYIKKVSYPPTPSGVMKFISSRIHDVIAEEAWEFVPKLETQSGYVTARMMQALGAAEDMLLSGDKIGARLAFIRTYNNLPEDNDFFYSEGYDIAYDEKEQRKIDDYKLLENKGWIAKESLMMIAPPRLLLIENGSQKTLTESGKKQVSKLRLITSEMPCLNQSDTGQE